MDELIWHWLLFDFYGDLLTQKQREIFSEYINDDFTISEIAQRRDVSRQGVHETLKRAEAVLTEYEETLGLIRKFTDVKTKLTSLRQTLESLPLEAKMRKTLLCHVDDIIDGM